METVHETWSSILDYMHELPDLPEVAYKVWISCLEPRGIEDGKVVVCVHTAFQKKIIEDHYAGRLEDAFKSVLGLPLGLKIIADEEPPAPAASPPPRKFPAEAPRHGEFLTGFTGLSGWGEKASRKVRKVREVPNIEKH